MPFECRRIKDAAASHTNLGLPAPAGVPDSTPRMVAAPAAPDSTPAAPAAPTRMPAAPAATFPMPSPASAGTGPPMPAPPAARESSSSLPGSPNPGRVPLPDSSASPSPPVSRECFFVAPVATLPGPVHAAPAAAFSSAVPEAPASRLADPVLAPLSRAALTGEGASFCVLRRFWTCVVILGGSRADKDAPRPPRRKCKPCVLLAKSYGEGLSKVGSYYYYYY